MNEQGQIAADPALALLLAALPLARRTRIVDVGANPLHDAAPYAALLRAGGCDVMGFEPQPEPFAALEKVKSDRETYLPFAVGDGSRKVLTIYQSMGHTSVFAPYEPGFRFIGGRWARVVDQIGFDTVPLDASPDAGEFDLMKIDIQGGECDVFRGAEVALKQAMAVIVELRYYPLYDGEPMLGGVDTELRRQGYFLHKLLSGKAKPVLNSQMHRLRPRRMRDQMIDGDAVYLRDMGQIGSYSDAQLMHLCVTACAVFGSHTLVLHCLDQLVHRAVVPADLPERYVDVLPANLRADGGRAG